MQRDAAARVPVGPVQHDVVGLLLAGEHRREQNAVVVAVRLGAEHGDGEAIGDAELQQFFDRAHAGHAIAGHDEPYAASALGRLPELHVPPTRASRMRGTLNVGSSMQRPLAARNDACRWATRPRARSADRRVSPRESTLARLDGSKLSSAYTSAHRPGTPRSAARPRARHAGARDQICRARTRSASVLVSCIGCAFSSACAILRRALRRGGRICPRSSTKTTFLSVVSAVHEVRKRLSVAGSSLPSSTRRRNCR